MDINRNLNEQFRCVDSLSWTGVIAGALVAIGLSFLVNIFDIGIGLSVVKHTEEGATALVIGGLLGALIGGAVSMFVAGWVSGYIARPYCQNPHFGILQAFIAWCLALVIALVLFAANVGPLALGSQILAEKVLPQPTVHLTRDENAPVVSKQESNPAHVTVNPEKATTAMGLGALATFLIFFVGALASCLGGYCATACCKNYDKKEPERNNPDVV